MNQRRSRSRSPARVPEPDPLRAASLASGQSQRIRSRSRSRDRERNITAEYFFDNPNVPTRDEMLKMCWRDYESLRRHYQDAKVKRFKDSIKMETMLVDREPKMNVGDIIKALISRAFAYEKLNDWSNSRDDLKKAKRIGSDSMNLETTCRILLAQARISFKLGAYVEAKETVNQILRAYPTYLPAINFRASISHGNGFKKFMKDVPIHALEKYPSNVMQQRTSPTPMVPEKSHFGPTGVNDQSQSSESQQQPRHVEVVVDMIDRKRETSTTDIKEKEPITHERKEQKEQKESWSWSPEKVAEWISSIDEPYKIYSHTFLDNAVDGCALHHIFSYPGTKSIQDELKEIVVENLGITHSIHSHVLMTRIMATFN